MTSKNDSLNLPKGLTSDLNEDGEQPIYRPILNDPNLIDTNLRDTNQDSKEQIYEPILHWSWGFTPSAEIWNGRFAMIGFSAATVIELLTGNGYLHLLRLISGTDLTP